MEITERRVEGISVIALNGDVDLETSPLLREALRKRPPGPLVVDFSGVGYIDSSGLATLIEYYQRTGKALRENGGNKDGSNGHGKPSVVLAGLSDRVRGAFELVRLNEIFPVHPDVDGAVRSLLA